MQRVIACVRSTLSDLRLAIEGSIIMNEALRDALNSIYDAKVPATWAKVRYNGSGESSKKLSVVTGKISFSVLI